MMLLQLSASHGPVECALAVSKALLLLQQEAASLGLQLELIEQVESKWTQGLNSALVSVQGPSEAQQQLARAWCGTLQWICASPYRPQHRRKNWFIAVQPLTVVADCPPWLASRIQFQSCKASGPGGQHVNKTDSAILATDPLTGLRVKVQSQRSQHANKALALRILASRVQDLQHQQQAEDRKQRRQLHWQVERGGALRVFVGLEFQPQPSSDTA